MELRVPHALAKAAAQSAINAMPGAAPATMGGRLVRPLQVEEAQGHGFLAELQNALRSVSAAQNHAGHMQREVQLENPSVSLEETMVAMQKAQIGFQATLQVRNRLVQAYTDVMNMHV